jgi:1,4-alpha-glucan branching enzyme
MSFGQDKAIEAFTLVSERDVYLFREGTHQRLYEVLGAHATVAGESTGTFFGVWAPNAGRVTVMGDFNGWDPNAHPLRARIDDSGIWEGFVAGVGNGALYKYHIESRLGGHRVDKGDPMGFFWEHAPQTASSVWDLEYEWRDSTWMRRRAETASPGAPMSVYEVHLGSWRRGTDGEHLSYEESAEQLARHVKELGFTHVELMPVMEHPFYGSWGYQMLGFFAPTSRYGSPQGLMRLVDHLHRQGVGVILDWVPSHFPDDEHGLVFFDGSYLYEHPDPGRSRHPDWNSYIFNYGRNEVRSFLLSSAHFWLDRYHADGLRVDGVASMLYLDYSRKPGEWAPNLQGGRENLEAISFLRMANDTISEKHPSATTIAEESTAWPMVTRPSSIGGLGFDMKWNMGWMHDTLEYFRTDPLFRKHSQNLLTSSISYAFSESFMLSLSHDEVVHGKGSLLSKMPGDEWQRLANLRALYGYMFTYPGRKLLFMGGEIAQRKEWAHDHPLQWELLDHPAHRSMVRWVGDLNRLYRAEPALHRRDTDPEGFQWVDVGDWERSIVSYLRLSDTPEETILVACNFTPVPRHSYRIGAPTGGFWREIINSDAKEYGGSGQGNMGGVEASPIPFHDRYDSISVVLPPLSVVAFKPEPAER